MISRRLGPLAERIRGASGIKPPSLSYHVAVVEPEADAIDGEKRGLLHNFPAKRRIDPAPLGFINADGRSGCLYLSTFHTFPLEHTVVKTQSLIEKRL